MQPVEKVEIYENNSSQWADLPELVMKKVLLCLKPNDRYSASLVSFDKRKKKKEQ